MRTGIISRAIAALLLTMSSALADIDSGGGQTRIGSELNSSSIGSPSSTGQYSLGSELNRTGLVETLYLDAQPATYTLEAAASSNGSIGGAGSFAAGTEATQTALPDPGYLFTGWPRDAGGLANPLALLMNGNRAVGATFGPDDRDPDGDGLTNFEEIVTHGTDPDNADTDGDGVRDNGELDDNTDPSNADY